MTSLRDSVERDGFLLAPGAVEKGLIERLRCEFDSLVGTDRSANVRSPLKSIPAIQEVFHAPHVRRLIASLLGESAIVVRSLLFDKVPGANWKVPWHQDQIIAVKERCEVPGFTAWSEKQGVLHVRPPVDVLEGMLVLRLHLDPCGGGNGPLKVLPCSHRDGYRSSSQIAEWSKRPPHVCVAEAGDLLVMRPLLLHASDRAHGPLHRRVLHFDLACRPLPGELQWQCELKLEGLGDEQPASNG